MKNKRTEIFIMAIILIIQTIIYVCVSMQKSYLHIDEAYSFGLTNYDKMEIQDNTDFFNTWHENEYFEDYLAVQDDEKWDFTPVYENQKMMFILRFITYYFISQWDLQMDKLLNGQVLS